MYICIRFRRGVLTQTYSIIFLMSFGRGAMCIVALRCNRCHLALLPLFFCVLLPFLNSITMPLLSTKATSNVVVSHSIQRIGSEAQYFWLVSDWYLTSS